MKKYTSLQENQIDKQDGINVKGVEVSRIFINRAGWRNIAIHFPLLKKGFLVSFSQLCIFLIFGKKSECDQIYFTIEEISYPAIDHLIE